MENETNFNHDFDPEFSEYNPICANVPNLEKEPVKDDPNLLMSFIKKLTTPIIIQLD